MVDPVENAKSSLILDAALAKFTAYGFARTSMADIAAASAMSRPAVYQHYANKEAIFLAVLARVLECAAGKAVLALETAPDLESQIDGFLQRWSGDLIQQFRATEHGADIINAKTSYAKPVVDAVDKLLRRAVHGRLEEVAATKADELTDLVLLAPIGLRSDHPPLAKYRRRLSSLASSIALVALSGSRYVPESGQRASR